MARRRGPRRLQLGPVVGHTDDTSTRIWIQVSDDPARYRLRVEGVGLFEFKSAPSSGGRVRHRDRAGHRPAARPALPLPGGASGPIRAGREWIGPTLPPPPSMTNLLFCAISCNGAEQLGAWQKFSDLSKHRSPRSSS